MTSTTHGGAAPIPQAPLRDGTYYEDLQVDHIKTSHTLFSPGPGLAKFQRARHKGSVNSTEAPASAAVAEDQAVAFMQENGMISEEPFIDEQSAFSKDLRPIRSSMTTFDDQEKQADGGAAIISEFATMSNLAGGSQSSSMQQSVLGDDSQRRVEEESMAWLESLMTQDVDFADQASYYDNFAAVHPAPPANSDAAQALAMFFGPQSSTKSVIDSTQAFDVTSSNRMAPPHSLSSNRFTTSHNVRSQDMPQQHQTEPQQRLVESHGMATTISVLPEQQRTFFAGPYIQQAYQRLMQLEEMPLEQSSLSQQQHLRSTQTDRHQQRQPFVQLPPHHPQLNDGSANPLKPSQPGPPPLIRPQQTIGFNHANGETSVLIGQAMAPHGLSQPQSGGPPPFVPSPAPVMPTLNFTNLLTQSIMTNGAQAMHGARQSVAIAPIPPLTAAQSAILALGPKQIKGETMLDLAETMKTEHIKFHVDRLYMAQGEDERLLNTYTKRITHAIKARALNRGRPWVEVRHEFNEKRTANGITNNAAAAQSVSIAANALNGVITARTTVAPVPASTDTTVSTSTPALNPGTTTPASNIAIIQSSMPSSTSTAGYDSAMAAFTAAGTILKQFAPLDPIRTSTMPTASDLSTATDASGESLRSTWGGKRKRHSSLVSPADFSSQAKAEDDHEPLRKRRDSGTG